MTLSDVMCHSVLQIELEIIVTPFAQFALRVYGLDHSGTYYKLSNHSIMDTTVLGLQIRNWPYAIDHGNCTLTKLLLANLHGLFACFYMGSILSKCS